MNNPYLKAGFNLQNNCNKNGSQFADFMLDEDTYHWYYLNKLINMCIGVWKWENLPEEIVPTAIEEKLVFSGMALFAYDENMKAFGIMNVAESGEIDIYNHPDKRFAFASSYAKMYDKYDSVLIQDKPILSPDIFLCNMYAKSLANLRCTKEINIYAHRTPVILKTTADGILTGKNLINKYNMNVPEIEVDVDIGNMSQIDVLNLNPPKVFPELAEEVRRTVNDFLSDIGVNNADTTKRERLITNEVEANNEGILLVRNTKKMMRERACNQINKMYGLDVSVKYNAKDIDKYVDSMIQSIIEDTDDKNEGGEVDE